MAVPSSAHLLFVAASVSHAYMTSTGRISLPKEEKAVRLDCAAFQRESTDLQNRFPHRKRPLQTHQKKESSQTTAEKESLCAREAIRPRDDFLSVKPTTKRTKTTSRHSALRLSASLRERIERPRALFPLPLFATERRRPLPTEGISSE